MRWFLFVIVLLAQGASAYGPYKAELVRVVDGDTIDVTIELCHLKHHDHSPKFWKEVERAVPDYLEFREWLKTNGRSLAV